MTMAKKTRRRLLRRRRAMEEMLYSIEGRLANWSFYCAAVIANPVVNVGWIGNPVVMG